VALLGDVVVVVVDVAVVPLGEVLVRGCVAVVLGDVAALFGEVVVVVVDVVVVPLGDVLVRGCVAALLGEVAALLGNVVVVVDVVAVVPLGDVLVRGCVAVPGVVVLVARCVSTSTRSTITGGCGVDVTVDVVAAGVLDGCVVVVPGCAVAVLGEVPGPVTRGAGNVPERGPVVGECASTAVSVALSSRFDSASKAARTGADTASEPQCGSMRSAASTRSAESRACSSWPSLSCATAR
jgi:hypothetical protein